MLSTKQEETFHRIVHKFLAQEEHQKWSINKAEEEIIREFSDIEQWRENTWYKDLRAEDLEPREEFSLIDKQKPTNPYNSLLSNTYRKINLVAFKYNNTHSSYNSSTIILNGHKFLALEAPTAETVGAFLQLLQDFQVTHLVRLTPAQEENTFKSYPYWRENKDCIAEKGETFLSFCMEGKENNFPFHGMRYIWTNSWKDHQAVKEADLLDLILKTRKEYTESSLVAVHCHSGVARTGTFIAGFILLDEIDKQIAKSKKPEELDTSIEKIVKQLSLQRLYMVGKPKQYLMLYRLVDHYIKNL